MKRRSPSLVTLGRWWAVVDRNRKRPPCIIGRRKSDAEMMCDPDERVVRVRVYREVTHGR